MIQTLTLHEMVSVLWKTTGWGRRQEAFIGQRIKNKEETNRKWLDRAILSTLFGMRKLILGWLGVWGLADFLVKPSTYRYIKVKSKLQFADMAPWA